MKQNFEALVAHLMDGGFFLEEAVEVIERSMIECALARTGENRSAAAKMLGIHRNTLGKKIEALKIETKRPARKPVARASKSVAGRRKAAAGR